jgi:hypothetical protein
MLYTQRTSTQICGLPEERRRKRDTIPKPVGLGWGFHCTASNKARTVLEQCSLLF